jgi:hypothetical protein
LDFQALGPISSDWVGLLSIFPYELVQMAGYALANDPVSFDFEILTVMVCF